jgi:hypothetical protein
LERLGGKRTEQKTENAGIIRKKWSYHKPSGITGKKEAPGVERRAVMDLMGPNKHKLRVRNMQTVSRPVLCVKTPTPVESADAENLLPAITNADRRHSDF